jgi:hypothetical protein
MPYFQLSNGKTIYLTIDQYLDLTDEDIQYLISIDCGNQYLNPFNDSAVVNPVKEKSYDFDYLPDDDNDDNNDLPFDPLP